MSGRLSVKTDRNGTKVFKKAGYTAYIGEVMGQGRKYGYYVHISRGTNNLQVEKALGRSRNFKRKGDAEKAIRKWLSSK